MNKNITLYTLEGCPLCERLKNELLYLKLRYTEINCTNQNNECDKLENRTNCNLYPMCILESYPNKKILMCLAKETNQLNQIKNLNSATILTYVHSIDNMLTVIKNG